MAKMTWEELAQKINWEGAKEAHTAIGGLLERALWQPPEVWGGILAVISREVNKLADSLLLDGEMKRVVNELIEAMEVFVKRGDAKVHISIHKGRIVFEQSVVLEDGSRDKHCDGVFDGEPRMFLVDLAKALRGDLE